MPDRLPDPLPESAAVPRIGVGAAALWLALTLLFCACGWLWASGRTQAEQMAHASRQLDADAASLRNALDKNESLPFVLALQPAVWAALARPRDAAAVSALNAYLAEVARRAQLAAAYVVDVEGLTIAASNWNTPASFVGRNYRFRPYVQAALAGETGRFYGVGTTTADPGYFLARPVAAASSSTASAGAIGAVAIKIRLADQERTWRASDDPVALIDANAIVFLANNEAWKYHSLGPLDAPTRQNLARSQQYIGREVSLLEAEPPGGAATRIERSVGPLGWRLTRFVSTAPAHRAALGSVVSVAALSALLAALVYARQQRGQRLESARRAAVQRIEDARQLEAQIAQRTQELVRANTDISHRYAELKRTEHLLRATQNELVQAGKLGMLGQMAAGVTHELSQPLTALRAFAENARVFLERGDAAAAAENLGHIGAACERMRRIVGQLKGFIRNSPQLLGPARLAVCVDNAMLLLRGEIARSGVTVALVVDPDATVLVDNVRLEQVIVNLLRNAVEAVGDSGTGAITVTVEAAHCVQLRIADNGPGLAPDAREHLFEPFFTTKAESQGLGLGLAISSSIVQAMQGELVAHNRDTGGAEFLLTLPRHAALSAVPM